jgi:hypothetical protein
VVPSKAESFEIFIDLTPHVIQESFSAVTKTAIIMEDGQSMSVTHPICQSVVVYFQYSAMSGPCNHSVDAVLNPANLDLVISTTSLSSSARVLSSR